MTRKPIFFTVLVLIALSMMLGACKRAAVPDLPDLPEEDKMSAEAAENTTPAPTQETQTGEGVQPTPTEPPPATPTTVPEATQPPAPTPTAVPAPTETPQPAVTTVPATSTGPTTYVVKAGDNLFRIAVNHNTTVEAIANANNITNPTLIYVGQKLTIPGTGTPVTEPPASGGEKVHVIQPGENLFRVALKYNYDYFYLAKYNNISNPALVYVGQKIRIP